MMATFTDNMSLDVSLHMLLALIRSASKKTPAITHFNQPDIAKLLPHDPDARATKKVIMVFK
jgi:hypothetical protein